MDLCNKLITAIPLLSLMACRKGPVPVTESEVGSVVKVDTAFFQQGWITGDDLIEINFHPVPSHSGLFYILGVALLFLVSCAVIFGVIRYFKRKEMRNKAEESQVVISLLKEKVSMVSTLSTLHEVALKRKESQLSYMDELEALQAVVSDYHDYLQELRGNLSFMGDLESALNTGGNGIMRKARYLLGTSIDESDYFILACSLAGMKPTSISFITNVNPGTIRTRKSRIKKRIRQTPPSLDRKLVLEGLEKTM